MVKEKFGKTLQSLKILWPKLYVLDTFTEEMLNGKLFFFPASISSRVLQVSRKSTGADCLHMVGRISILLCNLYGLKSPEKSKD